MYDDGLMYRNVPLAKGEYYHIYSRGVEKRPIFIDDYDRDRFIKLLYIANSAHPFVFREVQQTPLNEIEREKSLVSIGAYVLMDNHFHILIKEIEEGGISLFMKKLLTGYSSYFNKRHNRTGILFQSRFQFKHVVRDEQLKYLFSYIHLNPIKQIEPKWREDGIKNMARVQKLLEHYPYSSYADYIGRSYVSSRVEEAILAKKDFPTYFTKAFQFEEFIKDWLRLEETT